ncbi:MAG: HIT domain-containing protein [Candidatus Levyibacteriota bacterium]
MEQCSNEAMTGCVFCKIVKSELPSYKVYEDKDFLAFLDINPFGVGHTLVIPKKHYEWVWEVENYSEYFQKVKEIALLLKEKLGADWIQMGVIGIDVPHAHVHLTPHYKKPPKFATKDFTKIAEVLTINS